MAQTHLVFSTAQRSEIPESRRWLERITFGFGGLMQFWDLAKEKAMWSRDRLI
ncbi:hypothetical protein IQ266_07290 [filamentous cyanobacterium LEGE 11480]|uniref:Uncharacterized protein n=1 Tax=Romeriopsis navalis LEGE 11480 TaxID=2777977 RepID=A0A928VP53_9CYAN|nr:hypothetical protein [Romeriopsis navalis]MBE9029564.1 hypothetical protein [Romeriopsis navalis LEGE 11480]